MVQKRRTRSKLTPVEEVLGDVFALIRMPEDLELKNRYEVWASRADLAGILPRVDFEFTLPSYRNSVDEYEGLGEVFENEYLSYGGTAVVNQVLPSNTELSATFSYVDYQTYKYYGEEIEGGYKAGQLVFSARQYIR